MNGINCPECQGKNPFCALCAQKNEEAQQAIQAAEFNTESVDQPPVPAAQIPLI